ncbi:MAG: LptF/LptG family permease [Deltaproteobacteria bacterium]|nr:LptF/LptG family permease [Deltaproteobacteria bacterium]
MKALGQLDRLVLAELARLFAATLAGVVLLYLVIDFADRGSMFRSRPDWGLVGELYLNRAAVVAHQLAPVALILAISLLLAQLGRRGELVAVFSLGVSPWRVVLPVGAMALVLGGLSWLANERVVVGADARAEEVTAEHFKVWGDFGAYHAESHWLRGRAGRMFRLGKATGGGFEPAMVLEIDADFRLRRRLVAARMEPAGPGRWRLVQVREVRYADSEPRLRESKADEQLEAFPDTPAELSLRSGRPRQLAYADLREQAARRELLGQPSREYRLALAERVAGVLQLIPVALLAAAIALALGRRSGPRARPLSAAVAAGLGLSMGLWALTVVLHAASMGGSVPVWLAAALPGLSCALLAGWLLRPRALTA